MGHENVCANLHGHNYRVEITAAPLRDLDMLGRVVDFSVIKERVGAWIDENWDHAFLINQMDKAADQAMAVMLDHGVHQRVFHCTFNPTAEEMAAFLLVQANRILISTGVQVVKIRLWETDTCYAEVAV